MLIPHDKLIARLEKERAAHEKRKIAFIDGGNLLLAADMQTREETINQIIAIINKGI